MTTRTALTEKILVLGVDGFEPRLAAKYLRQNKMPNLQKYIDAGACRQDLVLLGAMPTVTPPMWTTLATGAYPSTHGITCFFGHDHGHLDTLVYNLDATRCQAEPLWNVFAESGKKTLVWHWPGSSWPPTSESPNLHVVDGTQPIAVNAGCAGVDIMKLVYASESFATLDYLPNTAVLEAGAGCIIDDVEALIENQAAGSDFKNAIAGADKVGRIKNIITCEAENETTSLTQLVADTVKSPIKPAQGWPDAPADAKEFVILVSNGLVRHPALLLKNAQGQYDTVSIYPSKKDAQPLVTLTGETIAYNVLDTAVQPSGAQIPCVRHYQTLSIAPDGSSVSLIINTALDITADTYFHPQSLYQEITQNIGYVPARPGVNGTNENLVEKSFLPIWDHYCQWQADCLLYCMEQAGYSVIFSHLHNVDCAGHLFWHYGKHQDKWNNHEARYQHFMEEMYIQTDRYLGRFLNCLADGWTIIITSDHGLITQENLGPEFGEPGGITTPVMEQLGYTTLLRGEDGRKLREIDWTQTRAVASRGNYIYLNLKGRDEFGIVDPAEQYALEEQIISDIYNYRDPQTGRRIVALAMRNKDALLLGMSGPECGDIIFFTEESFNVIHADSLSTQCGYADTSVSPIFIAAGQGIQPGLKTQRVIRQVDVAPTIAVLGGVRMPRQCEGAPVYQILAEEF